MRPRQRRARAQKRVYAGVSDVSSDEHGGPPSNPHRRGVFLRPCRPYPRANQCARAASGRAGRAHAGVHVGEVDVVGVSTREKAVGRIGAGGGSRAGEGGTAHRALAGCGRAAGAGWAHRSGDFGFVGDAERKEPVGDGGVGGAAVGELVKLRGSGLAFV